MTSPNNGVTYMIDSRHLVIEQNGSVIADQPVIGRSGSASSNSGSSGSTGNNYSYSSPSSYSISSGGMSWLSSNWPTLYSALASGNSSAVSSAISNAGPDPAYQQKIISQFKANYPSDAAKLGLG